MSEGMELSDYLINYTVGIGLGVVTGLIALIPCYIYTVGRAKNIARRGHDAVINIMQGDDPRKYESTLYDAMDNRISRCLVGKKNLEKAMEGLL